MTTVRQLYALQEVDIDLDRLDSRKAEAERELERAPDFDSMELVLLEGEDRIEELRGQQREIQLELDTVRQRSAHLDEQLFSGNVANPRDLTDLEQEAANVRAQLQKHDGEMLEISLVLEEADGKCAAMRQQIADARAYWETRRVELQGQLTEIDSLRESVSDRRAALAAEMDPAALRRYETLRFAKGGRAIARVERGLCQVCRMSLPTQQQQRVRSGRQIVHCSTCGRMLFLG